MNLSSDRSRNVMSLADYLQTERKDREPGEITVLHLDYTKATEIEGLTDEYVNLEILTLVCVGLQSLKGVPSLPALKQLDLTGNSISGGLEILVTNCPRLESLTLNGNPIDSVDSIKPLAQLSHLSSLDLYDCPVHEVEGLKETVFQMIPHLKYLDGMDINNVEEPDDDEGDDGEEEDDEYVEVSEEGDEEEEYEAGGYAETEESNTNQSGARGENQAHFNHLAGRSRGEDDLEFVPDDEQEGDDEDGDESEGDDDEGGEGEEESYTEDDSSAPKPRGPKRKYPFPVSEEEYTGDSAPGNE